MSLCTSLRALSCALWRDHRGNVAMIFALALLPLVLSVGLAVDTARAYAVKSKLSQALDAAALAVGSSSGTAAELQALGQKFFDANFDSSGLGTAVNFTVSISGDIVTASASAQVDTTVMRVVGVDTIGVEESSEVTRSIRGLELAMVLDNTGSMTSNNNIGALRTAAQELVDILFGGHADHPTLRVAVVPYSASVNPGAAAADLILASVAYEPSSALGWKGCVIERLGHEMEDSPVSTAYWQQYKWLPAVDNTYTATKSSTVRADPSYGNGGTGPNLGCPTPITPLTGHKASIDSAVQALRAWSRGGTFGDIGMAWGLRVLSPEAPFTEGLAWNTPKWSKAVILMTDGDNGFFKLSSSASPNNANSAVNSDYTGYGRLDQYGFMGTTSTTAAKTVINSRLSQVCQDMKDKGITVYTITFTSGINQSTKDIYKACASSPSKWFDSPSQADLQASFRAIATELSQLRVSH